TLFRSEAKALGRVAREVEEAEEVDVLRPLVGLAAEGDVLALVLPRGDRGEEDGAGIGARRPAVEDDGRACRPPREALERHGAVGRAQVLAVSKEDVVARQKTERGLLAGGDAERVVGRRARVLDVPDVPAELVEAAQVVDRLPRHARHRVLPEDAEDEERLRTTRHGPAPPRTGCGGDARTARRARRAPRTCPARRCARRRGPGSRPPAGPSRAGAR